MDLVRVLEKKILDLAEQKTRNYTKNHVYLTEEVLKLRKGSMCAGVTRESSEFSIEGVKKVNEQSEEVISYLKAKERKLVNLAKVLSDKCEEASRLINEGSKLAEETRKKILIERRNTEEDKARWDREIEKLKEENLTVIEGNIDQVDEIEKRYSDRIKYEEENLEILREEIKEVEEKIKKTEFDLKIKVERIETFKKFNLEFN